MATVLALGHVLGVAIALWTFNARAGGSFWHGVPPSLLLISPEWFMVSAGKAIGWEITLVVWLARGKPSSPWGVRPGSRSGRITRLTPAERAARDRAMQAAEHSRIPEG
ncbi:hypothetical protein JS756_30920 [Streptomyces actuosus]|uniref:DUF2637 domain-containing protein n=1 Tax=Streptomyces actuosus TaxID=1885 RepID=A0ABS2VZ52_STRAS|nr:hypothetical protein [Streptomyces actuosus]MBN0048438.1 hypothetical protein [Streptomyces actuosus]